MPIPQALSELDLNILEVMAKHDPTCTSVYSVAGAIDAKPGDVSRASQDLAIAGFTELMHHHDPRFYRLTDLGRATALRAKQTA